MSIIPRLDEFEIRREGYDGKMEEVSQRLGISFLNIKEEFPHTDRQLWSSRDSIHISENKGLPLLMTLIAERVQSLLDQSSEPLPPPKPKKRESICLAFIWRELKHHNPLGM